MHLHFEKGLSREKIEKYERQNIRNNLILKIMDSKNPEVKERIEILKKNCGSIFDYKDKPEALAHIYNCNKAK